MAQYPLLSTAASLWCASFPLPLYLADCASGAVYVSLFALWNLLTLQGHPNARETVCCPFGYTWYSRLCFKETVCCPFGYMWFSRLCFSRFE